MKRFALAITLLATSSSQAALTENCQKVLDAVIEHQGYVDTNKLESKVISRAMYTTSFYDDMTKQMKKGPPARAPKFGDPNALNANTAASNYGGKRVVGDDFGSIYVSAELSTRKLYDSAALAYEMTKGRGNFDRMITYGQRNENKKTKDVKIKKEARVLGLGDRIRAVEFNQKDTRDGGDTRVVFQFNENCQVSKILQFDMDQVVMKEEIHHRGEGCDKNTPVGTRSSDDAFGLMTCHLVQINGGPVTANSTGTKAATPETKSK